MSVKIKKKAKYDNGQYEMLVLSGVTGKTLIKPLEKKYGGDFRLINNSPCIVRKIKK